MRLCRSLLCSPRGVHELLRWESRREEVGRTRRSNDEGPRFCLCFFLDAPPSFAGAALAVTGVDRARKKATPERRWTGPIPLEVEAEAGELLRRSAVEDAVAPVMRAILSNVQRPSSSSSKRVGSTCEPSDCSGRRGERESEESQQQVPNGKSDRFKAREPFRRILWF